MFGYLKGIKHGHDPWSNLDSHTEVNWKRYQYAVPGWQHCDRLNNISIVLLETI